MRAENRAACVEKINQLVVDYGLHGLVVCSRFKEYTALNVRLGFYRAIYIQPLTPEQVNEYMERAGDKLASLRATLQADEALRSMAQSPLILNIMSLAYQNTSAEDLSDPAFATDKARRNHLFDTYIARMFNRKAGARQYGDEQAKQRLSWLARNMQKHNQEVFLIEGLQPSWLSPRGWQRIYFVASRLSGSLIIWLIIGLLSMRQSETLVNNLITTLVTGLAIGLNIGFIDALRFEWFHKWIGMRKSMTLLLSVANIAVISLSVGYILGLVVRQFSVVTWIVGFVFGLIFGPRGSQRSLENDIHTVEALRWSWRKALKGGPFGVIVGLLFGLILSTYYG
ncbi:MAG: hypothetical protein L0287_37345, partial [Anaerolineae bacterium]|nr:hypothetical protein [Anaerolineae bacterium]